MSKVDISQWKEFTIGEIFSVSRPISRSQVKYSEGNIPFVASGNYNNGVLTYLEPKENEKVDAGKCLTVSPVDGSTFYQENNFLGRGGAGSSIIILRNDNLNIFNGYFISTVIRRVCEKYEFLDMGSKDTIKREIIKLPATPEGTPNWMYMEQYMKKVHLRAINLLSQLNLAKELQIEKIDVSKFKRFHLYDEELFTIESGTKLDKVKMSNNLPSINFIGRANINNGVTGFVDEIDGLKPYSAGLMTVSLGGEYLGSCFIQDKPFYTSQNVNVLIPKKEMSYYCKKYIATMIFKEGRLHYKAFIDELNRHMKTDFSIPLPVDEEDNINWSYMEKYMKKIESRTTRTLDCLST